MGHYRKRILTYIKTQKMALAVLKSLSRNINTIELYGVFPRDQLFSVMSVWPKVAAYYIIKEKNHDSGNSALNGMVWNPKTMLSTYIWIIHSEYLGTLYMHFSHALCTRSVYNI